MSNKPDDMEDVKQTRRHGRCQTNKTTWKMPNREEDMKDVEYGVLLSAPDVPIGVLSPASLKSPSLSLSLSTLFLLFDVR